MNGPEWLITNRYPYQSNVQITVNELVVVVEAININPILPLFDLERFSVALGTVKNVLNP